MSQYSPRLALPYIQPAQAQKHVTHNEAIERLDALAQLTVVAFDETAEPASPQEGEIWSVGAGAAGAWVGQDGMLAGWFNGGWMFIAPAPGWLAGQATDIRLWSGSAWESVSLGDLQNLDGIGINTTFDATNKVSVAADATLLNHDGNGHQLKLNKAAAADTASLLFQTGFSGRAEVGTTGEDGFSVKVSANGTNWATAMTADGLSGSIDMPNGATVTGNLVVDGAVSGTAVTLSNTDQTAGRLLKTGDYGLGRAIELTAADDLAALSVSGTYYNPSSSNAAGNGYPIEAEGTLLNQRGADGQWAQQFTAEGGDETAADVRVFSRTRSALDWTPWVEMLHQGRVVGTVSQTAGLPTGAILEHGSNVDGDYVKFADGTLMCVHKITVSLEIDRAYFGGFRSAIQTWTYPTQFAFGTTPVLTGSPLDGTAFGISFHGLTNAIKSGWSALAIGIEPVDSRTVSVLATGRWY